MPRTKSTGGGYKPRSTPGHAPSYAEPAPVPTPSYTPHATPGHAPKYSEQTPSATEEVYTVVERERVPRGDDL